MPDFFEVLNYLHSISVDFITAQEAGEDINVGERLQDGFLYAKNENERIAYLVYTKLRRERIEVIELDLEGIHALVENTIREFNALIESTLNHTTH